MSTKLQTTIESNISSPADQNGSHSKEKDANVQQESIFDNLKYICDSTDIIVQSLQKGMDVVQMKDGDIILTEVKTVNTVYSWDKSKNKLVKISHN